MVSETALLPRERSSFGPGLRRSPILVLESATGSARPSRLVDALERGSVHDVLPRKGVPASGALGSRHDRSAPLAWLEAREQFPAICVGLVAEPGSGVADAARILAEGYGGGPGPGAIALLGFSPDFAETCLSLEEHLDGPAHAGRADEARVDACASRSLFEWSPMMIFLPADDPSLGECALACRRMRAIGIPIQLEVMHPLSTGQGEVALDELVGELDRFFAAHLVPPFPKLL